MRNKKLVFMSVSLFFLLTLLAACNSSEKPVAEPEVQSNEQMKPAENEEEPQEPADNVDLDPRIAAGRELITKYIVDYYKFTTPEAFQEGYLNVLFDISMQSHPRYNALKDYHPDDVKEHSKAEIDTIERESVEPKEEGGFIYKATVTDKVFFKEVPKDDEQPFFYEKNDYELYINQDGKGEYKIFDITSKQRIYFPDM
ncbi:hypothetical protein [Paenibacillus ihbetae]|uniref:Lipoprotein n=1 Tax=Paenibacillus ihbetae TaxID=1870820 RepID=A0A1B2E4I0_9BACL|nr:hypothetical protein [Paenibacillus ihbetae]ANY74885.1 hypothetical protein BBD41_21230 [Paenibacillus ihbetae]OOC62953.1 hypothetical protein BBD40_14405 [Paenibacillus ihbetae]